jgi:NSS family neurotransmitter:Na+ symporter
VPYLIALFLTGVPLLVLEMGIGKTMRMSPPYALRKLDKRVAWVGWFMLGLGFVIISYYSVVIAWSLVYTGASAGLSWGDNTQAFFDDHVVGVTAGPGDIGGIGLSVLFMLLLTWLIIYLIIIKGIDRVAKVVKWTVPLPVLLLVILSIRSLSLDGADLGLEYYLAPSLEALLDPEVWLAAFGQVFFTLSIAGGVMIAYSSRLPKEADVVNNAHIVSLMNCGFSFFAGIVVFTTLGYMSSASGLPMESVAAGGPGLAFVAYPTAISLLPWGAAIVGIMFFLMLFLLGIDSAFAHVEAVSLAFKEAGYKYRRVVLVVVVIMTLLAVFFATGGGYHWLWIIDHFLNEIGLVLVGICECFIIGYIYSTPRFVEMVNSTSEIKAGRWWIYSIKYITPTILIIILLGKIGTTLAYGYEGYPTWALVAGGAFPIVFIFILAQYFSRRLPPRP